LSTGNFGMFDNVAQEALRVYVRFNIDFMKDDDTSRSTNTSQYIYERLSIEPNRRYVL